MILSRNFSKIVSTFFVLMTFIFIQCKAYADDWYPEDEIPQVTHIGHVSREARAQSEIMRNDLIKQLSYWKSIGLPNPPDLDALVHLGDVEHVRLYDLIAQLNPTITDVREHVQQQHSFMLKSEFAFALRKAVHIFNQSFGKNINSEELLETFFDRYAFFRYGFSVNNFAKSIASKLNIGECDLGSFTVFQDNAFYGRFPKIDLHEIFYLAENTSNDRAVNPNRILREKKLNEMNSDAAMAFSRRLVFLPRSTQTESDWNLLTIRDLSVSRHELGHHLSATYRGDFKPVHLLVEEVAADYIACAQSEDPKIGAFFAQASGEIALRFKDEKDRDLNSYRREFIFERMGQKGELRNMSTLSTLEQVDRNLVIANPYDAGHPLRSFLWSIRQNSNFDKFRIDRLFSMALQENSQLPVMLSGRANFALSFRSILRQLKDQFQLWILTYEAKKIPDDVMKLLTEEAHMKTQSNFFERASLVMGSDLKKMNQDPKAKKRVMKAYKADFKLQLNQLKEDWLEENLDLEKIFAIEKDWALKKREREEALKLLQLKKAASGQLRRKAVVSDYVIPEFLRAYYRVALQEYPELEETVIKEAAKVSNSLARTVTLSDGSRELILLPKTKLAILAISRITNILEKLKKLKADITELDAEIEKIKNIEDKSETLKSFQKTRVQLVKQYSNSLDALLEYERTGSIRRLYVPFMRQKVAQRAATLTASVFSITTNMIVAIGRLFSKKCETKLVE